MIDENARKRYQAIIDSFLPRYGPVGFGMGKMDHIDRNRKYEGSPYFYTKSNEFIHYTSIDSMLSILRSKKIRMFCLNGMDDDRELSYPRRHTISK